MNGENAWNKIRIPQQVRFYCNLIVVGSQMNITRSSSDAGRTKDLAQIGFSYGIGMILGPPLGEYITDNFGYAIWWILFIFYKIT